MTHGKQGFSHFSRVFGAVAQMVNSVEAIATTSRQTAKIQTSPKSSQKETIAMTDPWDDLYIYLDEWLIFMVPM